MTAKAANTGSTLRLGLEAIESGTGRLLATDSTYEGEGIAFDIDDVLFGKLRPYLAKAWNATEPGAAVGDFHVLRPLSDALDSRYLTYVLLSSAFLDPVAASVYGAKMPRASWDFVRNVEIWVPALAEQRVIVDYLDRETAQIDALLGKQKRLIEMLGERRRGVVDSELAKRGCIAPRSLANGNFAVPQGWQLVRLSQTLKQLTNGYVGPTRDILVDDGVRYIQGMHVKNGRIDFARRPFYVSREWHAARPRIHLREGDVLIVQTGDIGRVAVVPSDFGEASCHALLIARVRPQLLSGLYLGAFLSSWVGYQSLLLRATGALHPHLERGIGSTPIPVPPPSVQAEIVSDVRDQTEKIDNLADRIAESIALAKERRAALITAAVTGQINVTKVA